MIETGMLVEIITGSDRWFWFIVNSIAFLLIPNLLFTTVLQNSKKTARGIMANISYSLVLKSCWNCKNI
jgi:bacteriorhodopsin